MRNLRGEVVTEDRDFELIPGDQGPQRDVEKMLHSPEGGSERRPGVVLGIMVDKVK